MLEPKVSVVMPVYNVIEYLEECLMSVINQTLKDIEIICIDDGSTDGSSILLDKYADIDHRIKVVHNGNKGYGKSMNIGFSIARGEYIGVVETDDYIAPEMMGELYREAKIHDADVIKGDYYVFKMKEGERELEYTELIDNLNMYNRVLNPFWDKEVFDARINTWAGIYKREFVQKNNVLHNETPGASYQDNGFWFQVFTQARRVVLLPKPYYYLRRDNPNSSINSKEKVYCVCDEMKFIRDYMMRKPPIYQRFNDVFWRACIKKYIFNLKRISAEYKLDFLQYLQKEFCAERLHIDTSRLTEIQKGYLEEIMRDPDEFWREYVSLPESVIHFYEKSDMLILFGHGKKIYRVCKRCRFNDLKIYAIANLKQENNTNGIIPVINIEEVKDKAEQISVLIVDKTENREKLCKKLDELGFYRYLFYEES